MVLVKTAPASVDTAPSEPEAVEPEIAPLGLQQLLPDRVRIGMLGQHVEDLFLGEPEDALIMPERIVGIETDRGDGARHATSDKAARGATQLLVPRPIPENSHTAGAGRGAVTDECARN